MPATIPTVAQPDRPEDAVFLVTRRELAVLMVALAVVIVAVLLLVVTSQQVAGALAG